MEKAFLLPPGVPCSLDLLWVVSLLHFARHVFLLSGHGGIGSECGGGLLGLLLGTRSTALILFVLLAHGLA